MPKAFVNSESAAAIQTSLAAIFVSLELSQKTWVVTSLSPGDGERMSKHSVPAGDVTALLTRFAELKGNAKARSGMDFPIVCIQEAGLDGFWLHRLLMDEGIESHVVDPASIAAPRRRRRAKTDRLDGEALLRALMAFKRGEPRVCAMAVPPSPEEEDDRRLGRERKALLVERVRHVNRIKGLLFSQGISDFEPLSKNRRQRLEELQTGDGRPLPHRLKVAVGRELDRLELLLDQIKAVESERDEMLELKKGKVQKADERKSDEPAGAPPPACAKMLHDLKGIGPEFAFVIWHEGLYRDFDNRRQLASYAGLAPSPWQSGSIAREQGVSKAGNPRLRCTMIELAWLWVRHQPQSALSLWFKQRVEGGGRKKPNIVAMARKLLVALWKYIRFGAVIEGALMKSA
jgi:transposase